MDAEKPAALVGRRALWVILAAIVVAHLADLVTLYLAIQVVPMDYELNPFIRNQYAAGGFDAVVAWKLGWIAAMLAVSLLLSRSMFPLARVAGPLFAVGLGWFGTLVNLTTFVAVSVG